MNRTSWKCLLIGAVVAIALFVAAPQADAQWWGYYRPVAWGCYATRCCATCYARATRRATTVVGCSPCYYGSDWYLGVRPGPVRRAGVRTVSLVSRLWLWLGLRLWLRLRLRCRLHAVLQRRRQRTGSERTARQTPTPGQEARGRAAGGHARSSPRPAIRQRRTPPAPPSKTSATSAENSGVLTVWVPYDAKVTVNGLETKSTGSRRQFVSYGLKPGLSYKYVVKAEVVRNGQTVEDTRTVSLTAGQISAVAFGFNTTPAEQVAAAH